jgi:uncharacterized membrane protein YhaH (DUF805 family)
MNQPDTLRFPHRIGRLAYALRYLIMLVVAVAGSLLVNVADASDSAGISIVLSLAGIVIMVFALVALFRSILLPRLRDVGVHGAWALLILVPFLNVLFVLALLFIPPNAFTNNAQSG